MSDPGEGRGHPWVEIAATVLLALSTIASTWSAYQAARWSGIQTFRLTRANEAHRIAAEAHTLATQYLVLDAITFMQYARARLDGDEPLAAFILKQVRDEAQPAMRAWLAQDPFNNPDAPASPLAMPQYREALNADATQAQQDATIFTHVAAQANRHSDNYVLLTVLFAAVLFFAGIASKFEPRWIAITTLSMGAVLFLVAVGILQAYPAAPT